MGKEEEPGAFIHQKIFGYVCLEWYRYLHPPLYLLALLFTPAQVKQPSSLSIFLLSGTTAASQYVLASHFGTAGFHSVLMSSLPLKQTFIIQHVP